MINLALKVTPCGRGGMADAEDLNKLSARRETGDAELLKVGETSKSFVAIPSQARKKFREGVETRRAAPKPRNFAGDGEGIVQTANRSHALHNAASRRRKPQSA